MRPDTVHFNARFKYESDIVINFLLLKIIITYCFAI